MNLLYLIKTHEQDIFLGNFQNQRAYKTRCIKEYNAITFVSRWRFCIQLPRCKSNIRGMSVNVSLVCVFRSARWLNTICRFGSQELTIALNVLYKCRLKKWWDTYAVNLSNSILAPKLRKSWTWKRVPETLNNFNPWGEIDRISYCTCMEEYAAHM